MSDKGASAVLILDKSGNVVISRDYRGEVPLSTVPHVFIKNVIETEKVERPVFMEDGHVFCWILVNDLFFVSVSARDCNCFVLVSYLHKFVKVFKEYFKNRLNEEVLRNNFILAYELFDELMDHGWPQNTEFKVLKEYIKSEVNQIVQALQNAAQAAVGVSKDRAAPTAVTGAVSWRPEGIVHKKNEIFLDVVEKLNLLVKPTGQVVHGEILGALKMKSYLSGMPDCRLGLNDKVLLENQSMKDGKDRGKGIEMEDVKFHQCVRLDKFDSDRLITFVPPDGEFDLMTYRISSKDLKPLILVQVVNDEHCSKSRLDLLVKLRANFKTKSVANNISVVIPVPKDLDTPKFKCGIGSGSYNPVDNTIVWKISQLVGGTEYVMNATLGKPYCADEEENKKMLNQYKTKPVSVKFEIPYYTQSGITVRYLKVMEKSGYQAMPWVRYMTINGNYLIRMV